MCSFVCKTCKGSVRKSAEAFLAYAMLVNFPRNNLDVNSVFVVQIHVLMLFKKRDLLIM